MLTDGEPTLETAAAAVGYAVWWAAASSGRPAPSVQPEKRSSLLAMVLAVEWMEGAAARANGACACVCVCVRSDGTTTQLQANGTHKNQTGQAEGRSKHTRAPIARMTLIVAMETTLVVCLCPFFFCTWSRQSCVAAWILHSFTDDIIN